MEAPPVDQSRTFEIVDTLPSMIFTVDNNLNIGLVNKKMCAELSRVYQRPISPEDIMGRNLVEFIHDTPYQNQFVEALQQIKSTHQEIKFEHPGLVDQSNTWAWTISPIMAGENVSGFSFIGADITEKKKKEAEINQQLIIDPLTGLYTERYLREQIHQRDTSRHLSPTAFFYMDLDHLKTVNDNFGHDAGDELLTAMAEFLRSQFRGSDIIAHLHGDEYAVMADDPQFTPALVESKKQQIMENLADFNFFRRQSNPNLTDLEFSIGSDFVDPQHVGHRSLSEALSEADRQMLLQKSLRHGAATQTISSPKPKIQHSPQKMQHYVVKNENIKPTDPPPDYEI